MEFTKYAEMENSYRIKFLDRIEQLYSFDTLSCSVTEKIHGASFSIWYDGTDIKYAKRTAFISEFSNFYNWTEAIERGDFDKKIVELYKLSGATEHVALFGELCGGNYPHPDVPDSNERAVQKGVYYCPVEQFVPFDLKVDNIYMGTGSFAMNMKKLDIVCAPLLFEGSLTDCLNYKNDGESVLYKAYRLPKLPSDNIMEGVVIKPCENLYMGNTRIIIKNKNSKHSEKDRVKKVYTPIEFAAIEQKYIDILVSYLNENRIRNVLSKLGDVTQKDFSKLVGLVSGDCVKDFIKDNEEFTDLGKSARKKITRYFMKQHIAVMVRKNFLNIIDGVF